ncbi:MAG TPA: glycosyltransferase family 39 protein [Pirellulales bacterium]|nr:glycosyltransferase family 39 protein [Pirellulales bacterium]
MDTKRKIAVAGALVALACVAQAWTIGRAVVPAQDSIRYLTVAQAMSRDGLAPTIRAQREQPLFPALVCLTHAALERAGLWADTRWATSLQLAAALPLVFAVVPVYLLFRRLVGARAALCGGVLFCLAGEVARLGADGLADSTHLCFFFLALGCAGVHFAERRAARPAWLAAAGIFTGVALLARAEAVVIPVAVVAILAWGQRPHRRRASWTAATAAGGSFALGLFVVLAPFLAVCGETRLDGMVGRVLGRQGAIESRPLNVSSSHGELAEPVEQHWYLDGAGWLSFGRKDFSTSSRYRGWLAALRDFATELAHAFHYWLGGLALIGLWRLRARAFRPVDRLVQCVALALAAASLYVSVTSGYLSSRHLLALLVLGLGCAGVGLDALARGCVAGLRRCRGMAFPGRPSDGLGSPSYLDGLGSPSYTLARRAAVALAAAACLPALVKPLHASRAGHREAAEWLARNAGEHEVVLDSRGWTALYTGRTTYRYEAAQTALSDPKLAYVVVEQEELEADSRRGETLRLLAAQAMEPLARFAARGAKERQHVVVHRWHPDRFQLLEERLHAR